MHIFIDTNILETDPFWKNKFANTILELCKKKKVTIYISRVVYEELRIHTIRNYKKAFIELNKKIHDANRYKQINQDIIKPIEIGAEFDEFYSKLIKFFNVKLLEYSDEFFSIVMDRAIKREKPFNDEKTELKDCTIWLTYAKYAEQRMLEKCYLITNNTKDFFEKEPIHEKPHEFKIHKDLLRDSKKFRGFHAFQDFYKIVLEEKVDRTKKFEKWLKETPVDERYVFDLLRQNSADQLESDVLGTINELDVNEIYDLDDHSFSSGYIDIKEFEWRNCQDIETEIIEDDTCIVSCKLNFNVRIIGHKYNPSHIHENDKYYELEEKDLSVDAFISFYLKEGDKISSIEVDDIDYG